MRRQMGRTAEDVLIREMLVPDLKAVMGLECRIFDSPWTEELFTQELRRGEFSIYLVAESGGSVLGYIGAQVLGGEVHITNMAVSPPHRRRGLGSALLVSCLQRGAERGARWLTLEVREANLGARAFYRLFGFEEIGLRRGYYADSGEDAVIMATGDIRDPEYLALVERILSRGCTGGDAPC